MAPEEVYLVLTASEFKHLLPRIKTAEPMHLRLYGALTFEAQASSKI